MVLPSLLIVPFHYTPLGSLRRAGALRNLEKMGDFVPYRICAAELQAFCMPMRVPRMGFAFEPQGW